MSASNCVHRRSVRESSGHCEHSELTRIRHASQRQHSAQVCAPNAEYVREICHVNASLVGMTQVQSRNRGEGRIIQTQESSCWTCVVSCRRSEVRNLRILVRNTSTKDVDNVSTSCWASDKYLLVQVGRALRSHGNYYGILFTSEKYAALLVGRVNRDNLSHARLRAPLGNLCARSLSYPVSKLNGDAILIESSHIFTPQSRRACLSRSSGQA